MDHQLTLRVPAALARRLGARAREAGVKRSQLVRDALAAYLGDDIPAPPRRTVRERLAPYIGALRIDPESGERDELARRLRAHNWRE